ncbi:MAG: S-layer homology domain-containing protein [Acidimicrobiia bacterium]
MDRERERTLVLVSCFLVFLTILLGAVPSFAAQASLIRVSQSQAGAQADGPSSGGIVSGDGRYVVFMSDAANLASGDTNRRSDIFRYDRQTGQLMTVSTTAAGAFLQAPHGNPVISGDGRYVAFWSEGVFDAADIERTADVFLRDMTTGVIERLTVAPDGSNKIGDDRFSPEKPLAMSDDARWVAFQSSGTNLVSGDSDDGQPDLYVRDRLTGVTTLLSSEPTGGAGTSSGQEDLVLAGTDANAVVGFRVLSADRTTKRMVVRNLLSGEEHEVMGVDPQKTSFVAVAAGGATALVRTGADSIPQKYDVATETLTPLEDNVDWSTVGPATFSPDLRFYVGSVVGSTKFRIVDRETAQVVEAPLGTDGAPPNQAAVPMAISDDGTVVTFSSAAANLVLGDTNALTDSFVVKLAKGQFADDDGNPFEPDIEWLAAEGITLGCAPELFCPAAPVTRQQMASFLVRALDLPAATTDAFTDDDGSPHQADINALAATGITKGCGPGLYCPNAAVSRQEMASFLVRALKLPESTLIDFFIDDQGSPHEADINALAQAKITMGCGTGTYCPLDQVLRDQMAAFLHRALG